MLTSKANEPVFKWLHGQWFNIWIFVVLIADLNAMKEKLIMRNMSWFKYITTEFPEATNYRALLFACLFVLLILLHPRCAVSFNHEKKPSAETMFRCFIEQTTCFRGLLWQDFFSVGSVWNMQHWDCVQSNRQLTEGPVSTNTVNTVASITKQRQENQNNFPVSIVKHSHSMQRYTVRSLH